MKITALLENQTKGELKAKHGLSLYVETRKHNILFDLGEDNTLFENAAIREIDLSKYKAKSYEPSICVGGFHLYDPITKKTVPSALLTAIANELSCYEHTKFYTCHCTGMEAFCEMSRKMPNLFYFSCGETL